MKKYMIFLTILLSSIIYIKNVYATNYDNVNIKYNSSNNLVFDDYIIKTKNNINNYLNKYNYSTQYQNALNYFSSYMSDDNYNYILLLSVNPDHKLILLRWLKSDNVTPYIFFSISNDSDLSIGYNIWFNNTNKVKRYIYSIKEDKFLSSSTFTTFYAYFYLYKSNSYTNFGNSYIINSNVDIYYKNNDATNYNYVNNFNLIDNDNNILKSINQNDIFINSETLNSGFIKTNYIYEGLIETYDKSKIEINFDIPENETFSFDLDLLTQFSDIYLSKPYLEYTDIYDNITISQIDDFLGERTEVGATDTEGNELYQYEGKFGIDFNELKQLKIIFDVSNYTYDLYLKFISSLNYNINYIYSIDDNDYYKTIFMNDKYGIYLIPKTKNSDNFSTINLSGKYNIEIRNNYIDSENYDVLKKYTDYIEPNFQYKYTFNNLNYLIYFENVKYNTEEDDSYYLTFDTRQFNYAIKELQFDSPIINNPNTGEDLILPPTDNINKEQDISVFMDYIEKSFDQSKIKEYFNIVYNGFMNSKIGNYIFILIIFSIILLLLGSTKK